MPGQARGGRAQPAGPPPGGPRGKLGASGAHRARGGDGRIVSVGSLVSSGPLILAVPVAAAAGAVTFLSPCCLPLVPGYLSYVTGMSGAGRPAGRRRAARGPAAAGRRPARRRPPGGRPGPAPAGRGRGRARGGGGRTAAQPRGRRHRAVRARVLRLVHLVRAGPRQARHHAEVARGRPDGGAGRADDRAGPAVRGRARPLLVRRADHAAVAAAPGRAGRRAAARPDVRAELELPASAPR